MILATSVPPLWKLVNLIRIITWGQLSVQRGFKGLGSPSNTYTLSVKPFYWLNQNIVHKHIPRYLRIFKTSIHFFEKKIFKINHLILLEVKLKYIYIKIKYGYKNIAQTVSFTLPPPKTKTNCHQNCYFCVCQSNSCAYVMWPPHDT